MDAAFRAVNEEDAGEGEEVFRNDEPVSEGVAGGHGGGFVFWGEDGVADLGAVRQLYM